MTEPQHSEFSPTETLGADGTRMPPPRTPRTRGGIVIGGLAGAVAIAGAGLWGWSAYFAQGPQPDEALPADTLAYVSVDLDPPANQKVEAIRTLREFPGFRSELDLNTDDDLRKKLFAAIQDEGGCKNLDYEDDVEPWLGNRAAVAVVPGKVESEPDPVVVLQVTDADEAEDKLPDLVECLSVGSTLEDSSESGTSGDSGTVVESNFSYEATATDDDAGPVQGYSFKDDWVVLAETEEIAVRVTDGADKSSLAEDDTYQEWMDRIGDPGVMSMYAAPAAGQAMLDAMESSGTTVPEGDAFSLKDFAGAAGTLRFEDHGIEWEFAGDQQAMSAGGLFDGADGDAQIANMPDTTAVAFGGSMADDWLDGLLETFRPALVGSSDQPSIETMKADLERELGVSVDDIETLTTQPYAIVLDGEFNVQEVEAEGLSALPLGFKITGDPDQIERILDKLRTKFPTPDALVSQPVDGGVIVSTSPSYLTTLDKGGELGDSDTYQDVLPDAEDADAVMFIDFDAGGGWLDKVVDYEGDPEISENVEPLKALGLSIDTDGDVAHGKLRLTVD